MSQQDIIRLVENVKRYEPEQLKRCECCGTATSDDQTEFPFVVCTTCIMVYHGEWEFRAHWRLWCNRSKFHTRDDLVRKMDQLIIVSELRSAL